MSKSLSESAAEILAASLGSAKKEPSQGSNQAVDLGGQTPTSGPEDIASKATASTKEAPKPGTASVPAEASKYAAKKSAVVEDEEAELKKEEAEASSDEALNEEEVELTEEEIEAYLNSLTEEELSALEEEAKALDEMGGVKLPLNKGVKAPLKKGATLANPKMAEEVELTEEELAEARKASIKKMVQDNMGSCKEDVDALFNGESLSEDFRNKATTIFEAAVRARVEAIAEQVVSENEATLEETVSAIQESLTDQVDEFMNYVVENWLEENEVAIETGLRAELAEDFISGLKNLFTEHYIEVPAEKADLVEEMAAAVVSAEEKLAEQADQLVAVTKALNESKSVEILRKICEGLTEVQVQKIKALAEGVEFTTDGEYHEKLSLMRENYFPTKTLKGTAPETVVETAQEPEVVNNTMQHYVNAITKQLPK